MVEKKKIVKTGKKKLVKSGDKLTVSNKLNGRIYSLLVVCIIIILYVSGIIHYLNTLKNCSCFQDKNSKNYSNLTYLIVIESIILALHILVTIVLVGGLYAINSGAVGGANIDKTPFIISIIISLIIYGFFFFYVYKLSENVSVDCPCTQSKLRYLLYIQAIFLLGGMGMSIFNVIKL